MEMRGNVEFDGSRCLWWNVTLSSLVGENTSIASFCTFVLESSVNVSLQGYEERVLVVITGSEDFMVAEDLLAHLTGNEFSERQ